MQNLNFIDNNVWGKINDSNVNNDLIFGFMRGLKYENKNKVSELLNPINFFLWLIVSLKDIF